MYKQFFFFFFFFFNVEGNYFSSMLCWFMICIVITVDNSLCF